MKSSFMKFSILPLFFLLLTTVNSFGQTWVSLGGNVANGTVGKSDLVLNNSGTAYVAFIDGTNANKVSVKSFDGSSWGYVGAAGISGGGARNCKMAVNKFNELFVAFDDGSINSNIVVKKFDGANWVIVGAAGFSTGKVKDLDIACDTTGAPVVAYIDSLNSSKVSVKKYNGVTWSYVGVQSAGDLASISVSLAIGPDNTPYIAYIKNTNGVLRVRKFSLSWSQIFEFTNPVGARCFLESSADNKLYLSFWRTASSQDATYPYISVYDGSTWTVLLNSITNSIFKDQVSLAVGSDNNPYLSYNLEDPNNLTDTFFTITYNGSGFPAIDAVSLTPAKALQTFISGNAGKIAAGYRTSNAIYVRQRFQNVNFNQQPTDETICSQGSGSFSSFAVFADVYQWQMNSGSGWSDVANNTIYSGANTQELTITAPPLSYDGYLYRVIASNTVSADTSDEVVLSVTASTPLTITTSTTPGTTVCQGTTVIFSASGASADPLSYQWKKNGVVTDNDSLYTTSALANGDAVVVTVQGTNNCIGPASKTLNITVNPTPQTDLVGVPCNGTPLTVSSAVTPSSITMILENSQFQTFYASWQANASTVAGTGTAGSNLNQLNTPNAIFLTPDNTLYVSDKLNQRVVKYTAGSSFGVTVAGGNGQGSAANQLNSPAGLFVENGILYVSDQGNHRIQKWPPGAISGTTVAGGNGAGNANNQLNSPAGIFVRNNGIIYVADQQNNRVMRWLPGATSGVRIAGANVSGTAPNRLKLPADVFVDINGETYVADQLNNRIISFPAGVTTGTVRAGGNGAGSSASQLHNPTGIYRTPDGTMYIADQLNHRIQQWKAGASSATTVAGSTTFGSTANKLRKPLDVVLDHSGNIYVADQLNYRVQKFASTITNSLQPDGGGEYMAVATSFAGCSDTSEMIHFHSPHTALDSDTATFNLNDGASVLFIDDVCKKMADIIDPPGGNVFGMTSVAMVKTNGNPTYNSKPILRRRFDITPSSDGSATVHLYITETDFSVYNNYITNHGLPYNLLPNDTNDFVGASHIAVVHYFGTPSSGTTGPLGIYDATQKEVIDPASITFYIDHVHWVLSFPVTNLQGGYFFHSNSFSIKPENESIEETKLETASFMVYPNPFTDQINLSLSRTPSTDASVEVFDLTGKSLIKTSMDQQTKIINAEKLPAGVYLIRFKDAGTNIIKKITKTN